MNDRQKEIIKAYTKIAKTKNSAPTRTDLANVGISRDLIRYYFGNLSGLYNASKGIFPKDFDKIESKKDPHIHSNFTKDTVGSIVKLNDYKEGTFFVTAVAPTSHLDWSEEDKVLAENGQDVVGENLFEPGFKAVENFLKRNKAELVLLPMPAHVKPLKGQPQHYDPKLKPFKDKFVTEFGFNRHLRAIEAFLNPQQINPLTGLKRLRIHKYTEDHEQGSEIKRPKTSVIVAHSKQMMEVLPTGNNSTPRLIHSTGSITLPSYLRNRIGMIANEDHKLGGLIVEISGDVFWIRQVQFNTRDGSFIDMGIRYYADGKISNERAEAVKLGDCHPGMHDEIAINSVYELFNLLKPKHVFVEDFFDGGSITHHLQNKKLTKAKMPDHFINLPTEIAMAQKMLYKLIGKAPSDAKIIATASNHPEHVMRYLEEGRYVNDCKANYEIGHRMVVLALDGKNPLKEYLDPENKMIWTKENQDYFVEGVQMNSHGHLGINGARGSKIGHELAHGNAMIAHSHTPAIYHDTFIVGHNTKERHGYNNGPSTWLVCNGVVYKGGQKQLLITINGQAFKPKKK